MQRVELYPITAFKREAFVLKFLKSFSVDVTLPEYDTTSACIG